VARVILMAAGALFCLHIMLGFTGLPRSLFLWLMAEPWQAPPEARYVVVLGGAGIPSEAGLMRTYRAAVFAAGKTGVTYVVALPCDADPETSSVGRMRDELVMRGVPANDIRMEYRGRDTHEQAVNTGKLLGPTALTAPVVVVTSPLHVRRAVLCFRKAGFSKATGLPALGADVEADVGRHTLWRYAFWSNLERQSQVLRELLALLQYKTRGWI
jgi:uncharacterized SAM-binding protein YcdF (DUF218 family)